MKRIINLFPIVLCVLFVFAMENSYAQKVKSAKKATGKANNKSVGVRGRASRLSVPVTDFSYAKTWLTDSLANYSWSTDSLANYYRDTKDLFRSYAGAPWPTTDYSEAYSNYQSALPSTSWYGVGMGSNSNSLSINKVLKEGDSFSRKSTFEVEKDQKSFSMKLDATCNEGKIVFAIISPNKKVFKELVVNEGENRSWSKSIPIHSFDEERREENYGKWELKVDVKGAKGRYSISAKSR